MPDDGARAVAHLLRAVEELALAAAAGARAFGRRGGLLDGARAALRDEERRWAARAAHDPAAERVRGIFAELVALLELDARTRARREPARDLRESEARTQSRFDRPRVRWDTRARWRS
jgi:hypothetical protein